MRNIPLASLPVDEVIQELAEFFNVEVKKEYGEYLLNLPKNWGNGIIKGVNFDGGLGIIQYDCTFYQDTEIQFIVSKIHPLKFIYVLSGNLHHRFANEDKVHTVQQFKNAIVASCDNHGHILSFKKDVKTSIFSLEINRKKFRQKSSFKRDGMNQQMKVLFNDVNAKEAFYYEGMYSLKMADNFKKLKDFEGSDFLNMIFMESIAYQTLVSQISQFIDDQRQEKNRTLLRRTEIDRIKKASDYIHNNISSYKSLPELTRHTGLNSAKLQEGFKYLYNKTVNQYVYEARLNFAKELLIETDFSISEIVYKIGLSSKSYFSRIFKKEYGIQPSCFRNNEKNKA